MNKLIIFSLISLLVSCGDGYQDNDYEDEIEEAYPLVDIETINSNLPSLLNQKLSLEGNYKPYNDNSQSPPVAHALFFDTDSSAAIEVDLNFCNYYVFGDNQFLTLYGILRNNNELGTYIEVYYLRNNSGPIVKVPFRDP